jgi:endo-alpha-1,4-polygalactosaminidase (GH114 family)
VLDYLSRIVSAGFDGVYLDVIDAYEFFENE